ncbi:unnamed protein product [Rhodiola kirilowii]
MIQELLFGGSSSTTTSSAYSGISGDQRKTLFNNSNNGGIIAEAMTAAATKNRPNDNSCNNNDNNKSSNLEQNLRCPRCDSSNTKFCYYNNYNLTQPRHFCKTCRRYWTKGGALRNVPIGGGCRKNKTSFTNASKSFSTGGKPKASSYSSSADILLLKAGLGNIGSLDPQESSSSLHHPVLWPSPPQPQTSHLLAFLRTAHHQNTNPGPQSHLISSSTLQSSNQAAGHEFTPLNLLSGQTAPLSGVLDYPCSSFLRNSNVNQTLITQHQQVGQQLAGGVVQNSGIQELYQRLKLSTNSNNTNSYSSGGGNNKHNDAHVVLGNGSVSAPSSSPATSTRPALESTSPPLTACGGSDSGLWSIPAGYSTWINDNNIPAAANGHGDQCSF